MPQPNFISAQIKPLEFDGRNGYWRAEDGLGAIYEILEVAGLFHLNQTENGRGRKLAPHDSLAAAMEDAQTKHIARVSAALKDSPNTMIDDALLALSDMVTIAKNDGWAAARTGRDMILKKAINVLKSAAGLSPENASTSETDKTSDIAALIAERSALIAERDEADRRAGAAERKAEEDTKSLATIGRVLNQMKIERGYDLMVSFDEVWAEVCTKADKLEQVEAELKSVISACNQAEAMATHYATQIHEEASARKRLQEKLEITIEVLRKLDRRGDALESFDPVVHEIVSTTLSKVSEK